MAYEYPYYIGVDGVLRPSIEQDWLHAVDRCTLSFCFVYITCYVCMYGCVCMCTYNNKMIFKFLHLAIMCTKLEIRNHITHLNYSLERVLLLEFIIFQPVLQTFKLYMNFRKTMNSFEFLFRFFRNSFFFSPYSQREQKYAIIYVLAAKQFIFACARGYDF